VSTFSAKLETVASPALPLRLKQESSKMVCPFKSGVLVAAMVPAAELRE